MSSELIVAIIDDDRLSSHNWNVLLKFIGEKPLMLTGENWHQTLSKLDGDSKVLAVMVGSLMESRFSDTAAVELINAVQAWNPEVPILLNHHQNALKNLPESLASTIIELPDQSDCQALVTILKKARDVGDVGTVSLESSLISENGTAMFRSLVGESEVMQKTRELMHQVADKNANVLLWGESGSGKEILARNLHYHSGRGEEPFIVVNHTSSINEAELFGEGAGKGKSGGVFERAGGGTLFFDEISEMSLDIQAKLLQFLESGNVKRVGGEITGSAVRVIAASNKNLEEKINQGLFRKDLYYCLSVVPIKLPALREHLEDIPDLVNELISRLEHETRVIM